MNNSYTFQHLKEVREDRARDTMFDASLWRRILPYEAYLRKQLSGEQLLKLDGIMERFHPMHIGDEGYSKIIDDMSNLEERIAVETPFLIMNAKIFSNSRVFDSCLGSGATTIGLKLHSVHDVVSNDINDEFIDYALGKACERNICLEITRYDWRQLRKNILRPFDVVTCLGNSITYLFNIFEQQQVIKNFYSLLEPGGQLVIDTRNYTELLRGNFLNTGKGAYRGSKDVDVNPIYVSTDMVILRYCHKTKNIIHDLVLYPFKDGELERLMIIAGFKNIKTFGDYQEKYDPKTTEFYTFIGEKP